MLIERRQLLRSPRLYIEELATLIEHNHQCKSHSEEETLYANGLLSQNDHKRQD